MVFLSQKFRRSSEYCKWKLKSLYIDQLLAWAIYYPTNVGVKFDDINIKRWFCSALVWLNCANDHYSWAKKYVNGFGLRSRFSRITGWSASNNRSLYFSQISSKRSLQKKIFIIYHRQSHKFAKNTTIGQFCWSD